MLSRVLVMEFNFSSVPNRRFLSRMASSMAALALSVVLAGYFIGNDLTNHPLVWVLAFAHGLAIIGFFYAIVMLLIEQKDEFIRTLVLRQLIFGTGVLFSFSAVWGFLEYFGLVEHIYPFYFSVSFFVGFGFGGLVNRLTHGAWGEMS